MANKKLGQSPAFAVAYKEMGLCPAVEFGMSKRFYAACAAMQGFLSNGRSMEAFAELQAKGKGTAQENIIALSYEYADELLKQENE